VARTRHKHLALLALLAIGAAVPAVVMCRRGGEQAGVGPLLCQPGPTVPGIDVSHHQPEIAWTRVREAGMRFALVRVSDGVTVADTSFAKNWRGAKHAGLLRGGYQYFRPDQNALAQADLMINALTRDRGELPPIIDVEIDGGKSPAQLATAIQTWVDRVRDKLGVEPIVYTGPDFWRERARGADFAAQPLWLAHYTRACPTVPVPWTKWTLWQHTDNGRVPGVEGPVDLNLFAGTYGELEDFGRRATRTSAARGTPPR
jgi:lysozyme